MITYLLTHARSLYIGHHYPSVQDISVELFGIRVYDVILVFERIETRGYSNDRYGGSNGGAFLLLVTSQTTVDVA